MAHMARPKRQTPTPNTALNIHDLAKLRKKGMGYRRIAAKYGVAVNTVAYFWRRWKHLTEDPS